MFSHSLSQGKIIQTFIVPLKPGIICFHKKLFILGMWCSSLTVALACWPRPQNKKYKLQAVTAIPIEHYKIKQCNTL